MANSNDKSMMTDEKTGILAGFIAVVVVFLGLMIVLGVVGGDTSLSSKMVISVAVAIVFWSGHCNRNGVRC